MSLYFKDFFDEYMEDYPFRSSKHREELYLYVEHMIFSNKYEPFPNISHENIDYNAYTYLQDLLNEKNVNHYCMYCNKIMNEKKITCHNCDYDILNEIKFF